MRVAVVGGGLAGITAALACADAGAEVTLLEGRAWLGGATFSIERDGLVLDNGQHVFLRCCLAYRGLLARLGVEHEVTLQERLDIPVVEPGGRTGRLRRSGAPAPLHLAGSIARYPFLSPLDKARLGRVIGLRRLRLGAPALDAETFGAWLAARGQSARSLEGLWDLITLPTVNLPAAEASLALAAKVFKTGLLERADAADVGWARVPLGRLHGEAAQRALEEAGATVALRARVTGLAALPDRVVLTWEGGELDADAAVLAVPHDAVDGLLAPGTLPPGVEPGRLGVSPIVNVHVAFDRDVLGTPFAAAIRSPVQWVFDRTESSGLDAGQLLAISLSGARGLEGRSSDDVRTLIVPALGELFPAARGAEVTRFFVTREPAATFAGVPGSQRHRAAAATRHPRIALAGAWTDTGWPATMESAVLSGAAAARVALEAGAGARQEVAA